MRKLTAPLLVLIAISLASCNYGSQGIFYGLEKEKKTYDAGDSMPNTTTHISMTQFNTQYVAAAKSFYYRNTTTAEWSRLDIRQKTPGFNFADAVLASGTSLFVITGSDDSSNYALWSTANIEGAWAKVPTPNNEYPVSFLKLSRFDHAESTTTANYIVTKTTSVTNTGLAQYKVYDFTNGVIGATALDFQLFNTTSNSELASAPTSATFDGTNYFITEGSSLFTATAQTGVFKAVNPALLTTNKLGGIVSSQNYPAAGTTSVVIADDKGRIYYKSGAPIDLTTAWSLASAGMTDTYSATVIYGCPTYFDGNIIIPTKGNTSNKGSGYTEVVKSSTAITGATNTPSSMATVNSDQYTSCELYTAGINYFFVDNSQTLFAGTNGSGLWVRANSNKYWERQ